MTDPGDAHTHRDIRERLDLYWPGMGDLALDERREAAREIRLLRDEIRRLRAVMPRHIERIMYEGEG